jgi:putative ABC transport system ATP-binding protein
MTDNLVKKPIVQAAALTKRVSTGDEHLTILEDINLKVNAGDSVAVVGASGSGKSTLLGLLAGLDTPSSGRVHLDGEDIFLLGLGMRLKHYPKQLSGGEQQRVAIARAFVTQPQLLLADEPTGNLDSATGAQIIELMFELNRERGTTLVLVTHDEAISSRCAWRIRLAGGKVVN